MPVSYTHLAVIELEQAYNYYKNDPKFNKELTELFNEYANRPSKLHFAKKMTQDLNGAKIYLKREDLNHTGACLLYTSIIVLFVLDRFIILSWAFLFT